MKTSMKNPNDNGRLTRPVRAIALAAGLAVCIGAMFVAVPAGAQEFVFHAEPAATFFVDDPQMDRFLPGVYVAVRPGVQLHPVVALQWTYAFMLTPPKGNYKQIGVTHSIMAGLRLRPLATIRPRVEQLGGLFVDINVGYVRTGSLDRFGFDAGLGYGFQVSPVFSIGPVVRYGQIVQPDNNLNEDPNDAQFITVGLDLAFGPAYKADRATDLECPNQVECEEQVECPEAADCPAVVPCVQDQVECPEPCLDEDRDGVCDIGDRCPTAYGPPETFGCPIDPCSGKPLIVLVQFSYDSSTLPPKSEAAIEMDPMLDAVAKAIAQDPSCRVCIVGNASEEGADEYNTLLSERRATAVQGYLTARGVGANRIPTVGLGAACQLVPRASRILNRRVEFRRLQEGESCPTDCTP